jgi:hypothetical protein
VEPERLETDAAQRLRAGHELTFDPGLALADQRQREMRQRREIAARTHGPAARHPRQHSSVQTLEEELADLDARARRACRQRIRA